MIREFRGEYRFLSNFIGGVEQKYQAAKCVNPNDRNLILQLTAGQAKRAGQRVQIRRDWERIKLDVMKNLLIEKFSQEPFRSQLITTDPQEIQEGNIWGDKFWGVDLDTGYGENHLGNMLMEVRTQLISET